MPSHKGNGNPWNTGSNSGPPDLYDLAQQFRNRMNQFLPKGGPQGIILLVILVLVGFGAWTAYYTVPSDSVAVVQRFGKYLKNVPPGLHFKLPMGIDKSTIIPAK